MEKVLKDGEREIAVPEIWRSTIRQIVQALADGDYELARGVATVAPPSALLARQLREYVVDFGETVITLPDETWNSSITRWMEDYWYAVVDLWTLESGRSDLVLFLQVFEEGVGYRFEIDSLHVPLCVSCSVPTAALCSLPSAPRG